ncbi:aminoglycoside phosphotransferase family protein [Streptomyces sp. NPDC049555]|uniref:aminoglycoside phosphotransferase family protein n=1 Tax=Streptomyces sp. NPDC049555 TaxID=3154930 RepID=UPI003426AF59
MSNLSKRAEHAVALATAAGERLGLRAEQPRVLHDVFNVLVHLAPHPVVVRVPSLTLVTAGEQAAKQRHELAVTGWLADTGAPVVRPSPLVPREPVECGGRSLTFWEFVTEEPLADGADLAELFVRQAADAAALHRLLADYPGGSELPVLSPLVPATGAALARLRTQDGHGLTEAELQRAEREYAVLETLVRDLTAHFPGARVQTLHGDSPAYNILRTTGGPLFSDFEDVTRGPVEWDLTLAGPQAVEAYERAGGRPVDRALLDVMDGARLLQVVGALALVPQMPEMGPMMAPAIDLWRSRAPLALPQCAP